MTRLRRVLAGVLSAIALPVAIVAGDLAHRGAFLRLVRTDQIGTYAIGGLLSVALWALLVASARHPRRLVRAIALVTIAHLAACGVGGQICSVQLTHGYINRDALLLAATMPDIIRGFLVSHAWDIALVAAPPALFATAFTALRAARLGPRLRFAWLPPAGALVAWLVIAFAAPHAGGYQGLPPDVLWVDGTGGLFLRAIGRASPPHELPPGRHEALPPIAPVAADAPSIVVLFGESIRRDEVCVARREGCARSPRVDAAAPDRIGFERASSVASCTELASAVLWSGLPMTARPEEFARAPLLWDWAKARGYRTAYLASQNLSFAQIGLFVQNSGIDVLREARDRESAPSMDIGSPDERTAAEAAELVEAGGPAFVMVHFSNTHLPYRQTPGFTPFPTSGLDRDVEKRNAYRNAVAFNDAVIGDLLTKLRAGARGKRAIVISLSDHGEAWREHATEMHTFSVYGEEIDVPLWIDAPEGTIPQAARDRLRRDAASRVVVTYDVAATIVDLLGGLDAPSLRERAARLAGTSLLREAPPQDREIILWNCPAMRSCAIPSAGILRWPIKVHYAAASFRWTCFDEEADPRELTPLPLGDARCAGMLAEARSRWRSYPEGPGGRP